MPAFYQESTKKERGSEPRYMMYFSAMPRCGRFAAMEASGCAANELAAQLDALAAHTLPAVRDHTPLYHFMVLPAGRPTKGLHTCGRT